MNFRAIKQNNDYARRVAIMVVMLTAALPSAWARQQKSTDQAVQVVSQLSFQGKSAIDMVPHQIDGKSYLYVRLAGDDGVLVIDVTHANKPKIVSSLQSSGMVSASRLEIEKDVALVSGGAQTTDSAPSDNDHLTVWDISKAGTPRVVQEFPGVRKVIEDARGYIYILDRESLWVVRDKPEQPAGEDNMLLGIYG